jgi:hypothetical protein
MPYDEDLADRIRECLTAREGIEERTLFGCACFLSCGNVLAGVWGDSLVARVGPERYGQALLEPHVREFDLTGRPMRGWVRVSAEGVEDDDQLSVWVERAMEFVTGGRS